MHLNRSTVGLNINSTQPNRIQLNYNDNETTVGLIINLNQPNLNKMNLITLRLG